MCGENHRHATGFDPGRRAIPACAGRTWKAEAARNRAEGKLPLPDVRAVEEDEKRDGTEMRNEIAEVDMIDKA